MKTTFAAALLTSAILSVAASPGASAAPGPNAREATRVAETVPARAATEADDEDQANCSRPRKRLWIEGEGWVVRKVSICR